MKKVILLITILVFTITLSSCTQEPVTCGLGTVIEDGKCVADTSDNTPSDDNQDDDQETLSCDDLPGDVFYEADFDQISGQIVTNEPGDLHTENNFVIWGKDSNDTPFADQSSVTNSTLSITGLDGTQNDQWHQFGLGYQYFSFETGTTYTVCVILEGNSGQTITSELGIYYGHGTKDNVLLDGNQQIIIQEYTAIDATNNDYGQYVIFFGNMTGDLTIHQIKILKTN